MQQLHWIGPLPIQKYNHEEGFDQPAIDPMVTAQALEIFQWLHPLQAIRL
jgi:hypothetical protein